MRIDFCTLAIWLPPPLLQQRVAAGGDAAPAIAAPADGPGSTGPAAADGARLDWARGRRRGPARLGPRPPTGPGSGRAREGTAYKSVLAAASLRTIVQGLVTGTAATDQRNLLDSAGARGPAGAAG
jgi:hypothetical protein